jgi:hypothetical protein
MIRTLFAVAALSMALAPQAHAWNDLFNSVWGAKGNDTGGIIPWSPENEKNAFEIAENNCKFWNKFPVATSIHRVPGDYIGYACVWDPPRVVTHHRRNQRVDVKIDK